MLHIKETGINKIKLKQKSIHQDNQFLSPYFQQQGRRKHNVSSIHHSKNEFKTISLSSNSLSNPTIGLSNPNLVLSNRKLKGNPQVMASNLKVKQIIDEMKLKERKKQKNIMQLMKRIEKEKQEESKLKQFIIAERRIKARVSILQRRQKMQQQKLKIQTEIINQITTDKSSTIGLTLTKQTYSQQKQIIYKSTLKSSQKRGTSLHTVSMKQHTKDLSNQQVIQNNASVKQVNKVYDHKRNRSLVLNEKKSQSPDDNYHNLSSIKKVKNMQNIQHKVLNLKIKNKVPNYLLEFHKKGRKRIAPQNQFNNLKQQKSINVELARKAVNLIQRISINHRLKQKNMETVDYQQATNKIQLLDYLFRLNEQ